MSSSISKIHWKQMTNCLQKTVYFPLNPMPAMVHAIYLALSNIHAIPQLDLSSESPLIPQFKSARQHHNHQFYRNTNQLRYPLSTVRILASFHEHYVFEISYDQFDHWIVESMCPLKCTEALPVLCATTITNVEKLKSYITPATLPSSVTIHFTKKLDNS